MTALDLDEVDSLDARYWWFSNRHWAPLQLRSSDYFKGCTPSSEENIATTDALVIKSRAMGIAKGLGANVEPNDRVLMLAQLRCFGIYFSPINFFFIYRGEDCRYLLAEVSNTPWNKRYCYLVDLKKPSPNQKQFHVSPFMDLDMEYRWTVRSPTQSTFIKIENWNQHRLFKAFFYAQRFEMSPRNVCRVLLQWPVVSLSIIKKIYWQAFRLCLKGIHYVPYQIRRNQ